MRGGRLRHYRAGIDGLRIHFIHEKGKGPARSGPLTFLGLQAAGERPSAR
jgi:hypothetical protein